MKTGIILTNKRNLENKKVKNWFLYINIAIIAIAFLFMLINLDIISVVHAQASESLPIVVFETYSALETSFLFLLLLLAILNILTIQFRYLKPLKSYIFSLVPFVAIMPIILLFFNPHTMILNPNGWPPTTFDRIELGGIIIVVLYSIFIAISIFQLYLERKIKSYLIILGSIIGGLLLSDLIHESGHAVITLLVGGQVEAFYPFPVLLGGEFNAGYVGFSNVPSNLIPLVLLGGEIFQWLSISSILIILYFKPKYRKNAFLLTLLFIGLLDFPLYSINNSFGIPHWFLVGSSQGDIILISRLTDFPMWAFNIIACGQLVITGLIIYKLILINRRKLINEEFS
jgi:hypothetical protein